MSKRLNPGEQPGERTTAAQPDGPRRHHGGAAEPGHVPDGRRLPTGSPARPSPSTAARHSPRAAISTSCANGATRNGRRRATPSWRKTPRTGRQGARDPSRREVALRSKTGTGAMLAKSYPLIRPPIERGPCRVRRSIVPKSGRPDFGWSGEVGQAIFGWSGEVGQVRLRVEQWRSRAGPTSPGHLLPIERFARRGHAHKTHCFLSAMRTASDC